MALFVIGGRSTKHLTFGAIILLLSSLSFHHCRSAGRPRYSDNEVLLRRNTWTLLVRGKWKNISVRLKGRRRIRDLCFDPSSSTSSRAPSPRADSFLVASYALSCPDHDPLTQTRLSARYSDRREDRIADSSHQNSCLVKVGWCRRRNVRDYSDMKNVNNDRERSNFSSKIESIL